MDKLYKLKKLLRPTRAVIFDFDGVLVDSEKQHFRSYSDVFARYGHTIDETEYYKYWTSLGHGARGEIERHGLDLDPDAIKAEKRPIFSDYCRNGEIEVFPEARELVEMFADDGRVLAVASGTAATDIDAVLEAAGLRGRFEAVVGSDTVPNLKPAPDVLFATLDRIHCEPYECLVIEDAEKGMHAAVAAHIPVMVVRTEQTREFDFSLADLVFDSHAEMIELARAALRPERG